MDRGAWLSFQRAVVPGADGIYRMARAIFDSVLADEARILILGAGGAREIEALGASARAYRMVGVDPAEDMLGLARGFVERAGLGARVRLVRGLVEDVVEADFHAAMSVFVMHFVEGVEAKARYLAAIRSRLRTGAAYLHVDVGGDHVARFAPVYARHAVLGGLGAEAAEALPKRVAAMPVITEAETLALFAGAGFRIVAPFYRGLWYCGWWLDAS